MATPSLFLDSSDFLRSGDTAGLRARAERDSYLFFKRLLPTEDVLQVRADLLGVVNDFGWRQEGKDAYGDRLDMPRLNRVPEHELRTDIGVTHAAYHAVQRLESVHRLPHHPALISLYRTLFAQEPLVHPRHIVRLPTPHPSMVPTPPHQDFPLIQGTSNTWTCWFPVGDCPRSLGGLTVLRGSHKQGYLPIQPSLGAGLIAAELCPTETDWVEGDYEIGDVLTFPSFTVHKALPSQFKDRIRLSLDVRYQPHCRTRGSKIPSATLHPFLGRDLCGLNTGRSKILLGTPGQDFLPLEPGSSAAFPPYLLRKNSVYTIPYTIV